MTLVEPPDRALTRQAAELVREWASWSGCIMRR
jgi:hypothetical protein